MASLREFFQKDDRLQEFIDWKSRQKVIQQEDVEFSGDRQKEFADDVVEIVNFLLTKK